MIRPQGADRFGLGWRPELAAGILLEGAAVDVVEVIAEDWWDAPPRRLRALKTLARQIPLVLHGVSLGMASASRVDERRLEKMARLVGAIEPDFWSEHLAFVRAGGVEIGHLAAPPRLASTLEGLARNVARATQIVGTKPLLENVATLIDPPGDRDETTFLLDALDATGADLLLDLHNLHANAVNFALDARAVLDRLPFERVAALHLAGGREIAAPGDPLATRVLDDHLHDVPDEVFALAEHVGRRAARPLTVVIERDGHYPPVAALLAELARARASIARGRARPVAAA